MIVKGRQSLGFWVQREFQAAPVNEANFDHQGKEAMFLETIPHELIV
jgi:hypothetical protein